MFVLVSLFWCVRVAVKLLVAGHFTLFYPIRCLIAMSSVVTTLLGGAGCFAFYSRAFRRKKREYCDTHVRPSVRPPVMSHHCS